MRPFLGVLLAIGFVVSVSGQEVYKPGNGVSLPKVVKQVRPEYTDAARDKHIEGSVGMDAVVLADGHVGDVNVAESLDDGLDRKAIEALKQWEFEPGMKDGKPVAVQIAVMMRFTLQ